jgi:hypothetical protein
VKVRANICPPEKEEEGSVDERFVSFFGNGDFAEKLGESIGQAIIRAQRTECPPSQPQPRFQPGSKFREGIIPGLPDITIPITLPDVGKTGIDWIDKLLELIRKGLEYAAAFASLYLPPADLRQIANEIQDELRRE